MAPLGDKRNRDQRNKIWINYFRLWITWDYDITECKNKKATKWSSIWLCCIMDYEDIHKYSCYIYTAIENFWDFLICYVFHGSQLASAITKCFKNAYIWINFKYITITIQPSVVKVTSCKYFGVVSTVQFPSINFWFLVNSLQFHTISIIISGCYFSLLSIESNFRLLSHLLQIFSLKLTLSRDIGTLPESIKIKLIHIDTCQWNGCFKVLLTS